MPEFRRGHWLAVLVLLGLSGCAGKMAQQEAEPMVDKTQAAEQARQGLAAWEQGDRKAAVRAWRESVMLDPGDQVTVNNLALALKEQKRFTEAARVLEQGIAEMPEVADLHYNLAVISELYLLDLERALIHYRAYRDLSATEDNDVAGWIADLERRLAR